MSLLSWNHASSQSASHDLGDAAAAARAPGVAVVARRTATRATTLSARAALRGAAKAISLEWLRGLALSTPFSRFGLA